MTYTDAEFLKLADELDANLCHDNCACEELSENKFDVCPQRRAAKALRAHVAVRVAAMRSALESIAVWTNPEAGYALAANMARKALATPADTSASRSAPATPTGDTQPGECLPASAAIGHRAGAGADTSASVVGEGWRKAFDDWAWKREGEPLGHSNGPDAAKLGFEAGAKWAAALTSQGKADGMLPDWKQDQAETTRIAPKQLNTLQQPEGER